MMKLTYKSKIRIQTKERQASPAGKPATDTLVETVLRASKVSLTAGASIPSCDSGSPPPSGHQAFTSQELPGGELK
jgi:hypothetical protein